MTSPLNLATVAAVLDQRYPPQWASAWDAVGLVCGDPAAPVRRVLFAVDPVASVVDEAVAMKADLVITHHPLFLTAVHGVAADTAKGRIIHRLVQAGSALFAAHTNADVASPGVSDALAAAIGLTDVTPLPITDEEALGVGRIGLLPEAVSLEALVQLVGDRLPVGAGGVRATGDPARLVRRVAVCGGAGDSILGHISALDVDAYVTGDLRHHRASEHLDNVGPDGPALIDATHFGTEWPWLGQAAALLVEDLAERGATVEVHVSSTVTDPWAMHAPGGRSPL